MYSKHTCVVHFCMVFPIFYHTNFWRTGPKFDQGLSLVQFSSSLVEIRKFSVWWSVWSTRQDPNWIRAMSCLNQARFCPKFGRFRPVMEWLQLPPFVTYDLFLPGGESAEPRHRDFWRDFQIGKHHHIISKRKGEVKTTVCVACRKLY